MMLRLAQTRQPGKSIFAPLLGPPGRRYISAMPTSLGHLVELLESIAPPGFAEDWDNVGLLLEPVAAAEPASRRAAPVSRALLTIDLTEAVLEEALEERAELVVAYHPPIFRGLKRLTADAPQSRVLLTAVRAGIAIYSPHTALDAAPGGVNDWLAAALGEGESAPIEQSFEGDEFKLVVFVPEENTSELRDALTEAGAGWIGNYSHCSYNLGGHGTFLGHEGTNPAVGKSGQLETVDEIRMEMVCGRRQLPRAAEAIRRVHPYEEPAWDVYPLAQKPRPGSGMGRLVALREPAKLDVLVARIKSHLGLERVRVAAAPEHRSGAPIAKAAVCAGAGGSLFEKLRGPELLLTGEMRHHDVLARVATGTSVVLCDHTNTERGYLPTLAERLVELGGGRLSAVVSKRDRDPLEIV